MTETDKAVHRLIRNYLSGEVNLWELGLEALPLVWGSRLATEDPLTSKFALRLAEFGYGEQTEDELREDLVRLIKGEGGTDVPG